MALDQDLMIFDRYHLLPAALPEVWTDRLIGRLVPNRKHPQLGLIPHDAVHVENRGASPQQLVGGLVDHTVQYTTVTSVLVQARSHDAKLRLTELLGLEIEGRNSIREHVKALQVKRYDMNDVEPKLKELMSHKSYSEAVIEFFEKRTSKTCSMVNGVVVCEELRVTHEAESMRNKGMSATLPMSKIGQANGLPIPESADIKAEAHREAELTDKEEAVIEDKVVIAISYIDVELQSWEEGPNPGQKLPFLKRAFRRNKAGVSQTAPIIHYDLVGRNLEDRNPYLGEAEPVESEGGELPPGTQTTADESQLTTSNVDTEEMPNGAITKPIPGL